MSIREHLIYEQGKEDKTRFHVPGRNITENPKIIAKRSETSDSEFKISLPKGMEYPDLLAPTVIANYKKGDNEIDVHCIAIINKEYELELTKNLNFDFYYNFTLDSSGGYQLNVYMAFHFPRRLNIEHETTEVYQSHTFNLKIKKGALMCSESKKIPLNVIKTIELFVINRNPETSRGTVTTVKSPEE